MNANSHTYCQVTAQYEFRNEARYVAIGTGAVTLCVDISLPSQYFEMANAIRALLTPLLKVLVSSAVCTAFVFQDPCLEI